MNEDIELSDRNLQDQSAIADDQPVKFEPLEWGVPT